MCSLLPRPSRVFERALEESGRSGQFGDVLMTYLPPFVSIVAEMVADMSSLHHQIDQAFPIFLVGTEKHGKVWA